MTISKKHFKAIAEILSKNLVVIDTIENFCKYFKSENPLFNEVKFREAVLKK